MENSEKLENEVNLENMTGKWCKNYKNDLKLKNNKNAKQCTIK